MSVQKRQKKEGSGKIIQTIISQVFITSFIEIEKENH